MSVKIGIIDYGIGNLFSISKAIEKIGYVPIFIKEPKDLQAFEKAILPGVGAFNACYESLLNKNFVIEIQEFVKNDKKLMGICVGMQLLFSHGYEEIKTPGLNFIKGQVKRIENISQDSQFKLPHIGWNTVSLSNSKSHLFKDINEDESFYFVHSYSATCNLEDQNLKIGISKYYNNRFVSYIEKNNIVGCQFHPEKSRESGLRLLDNFIKW